MVSLPADRVRAAWWGFGGLLALALLFVLHAFVGTLVFAVFIYYATRRFYAPFYRLTGSRSAAAALALFAFALPVLVLGAYAVGIALQELQRFSRNTNLGPIEDRVSPYFGVSEGVRNPTELLQDPSVRDALQSTVGDLIASVGFVGIGLLHVFVMFAVAFYLLRDGPRLTRWTMRRFADDRGILEEYVAAVDRDLESVFFGNILNAIVTGAIGAISYSVIDLFAPPGLGIPYAALVGLLAGAASLIPVVGMKLVYVPVSVYLFADALAADGEPALWFPVAFVAVSFVLVDTIPDLVLRPYVSGRNLHVGLVMLAYIFGPLLFGWYGIFLGPILLVLGVHFARIVLDKLLDQEPLQPYSVDPSNFTDPPPAASPAAGDTGAALDIDAEAVPDGDAAE